jgi:peptidoglycan/LPS O-acetylase OafA/YrhL
MINNPIQTTKKEWFPFLDGIRGFAAFIVVVAHCIYWAKWDSPLKSAALAVDVFMILSGFLMAYHYREREQIQPWESPKTWYNFYIRRFFRIAPLYYVLIVPALIFFNQDPGDGSLKSQIIYILAHVTFAFGLTPKYSASLVIPDWSLSLEMQFYLAFPFLMLLFKKFSYLWVSLALSIISLIANHLWLDIFPQPSLLFLKINFFVIGILLAETFYFKNKKPANSIFCTVLLIIISGYSRKAEVILFVVGLILAMMFYEDKEDTLRINSCLIFLKRILNNKVAAFMSDTSYSVYLVHALFLIPIATSLDKYSWYLSQYPVVRFLILLGIVIPPTYISAILLFRYVEKPGISLGRLMISK